MPDTDALDAWLREAPLDIPPGFATQVMAQVHQLPLPPWAASPPGTEPAPAPSMPSAPQPRWRQWAQWLVLLGSVAAGGLQLGSFVLGIWTAAGAA
jgi:hypothetical protein